MIVLALVWWAWSAFVWAANALESDSATLRAYLLVGDRADLRRRAGAAARVRRPGLLFAVAYVLVRLLHLKLYVDASRRGRARRRVDPRVRGHGRRSGWSLLIVRRAASAAGTATRCGRRRWRSTTPGPAWLTRERLRGIQQVAVAHFADRYGDFVIICLGESIVAVGVGVSDSSHRLTARAGGDRDARPADRARDVVDLLRQHRGSGPGAPARPIAIRCWLPPTPTATCTC